MSLDQAKYEFLSAHGFANHFSRSLYSNRQSKKIFSIEAIEDHDMEWLEKMVQTPNELQVWQFYFNHPVSQETIREILGEFGE